MMDTSEQYVKMCEGAEEIQVLRKGFSSSYCGELWSVHTSWKRHEIRSYEERSYVGGIWLPRQDQLQKLVEEEGDILPWTLNRRFWKWSHEFYEHDIADYYNSFEKLWLVFVMKEKYGKTWDGDNWSS